MPIYFKKYEQFDKYVKFTYHKKMRHPYKVVISSGEIIVVAVLELSKHEY